MSEDPAEEVEEKTELEIGIHIDPDGRVVLTELPADLLDLVLALDPDAQVACALPTSTDDGAEDS